MNAGHYFDDDPGSGSSPHPVEITLPDLSLTLTADRGVFSADRLDAGTKLLLMEAPPLAAATTILDLGCGWGPIACVAARRAPDARIWAVDVNRRARTLTAANAASRRCRLELIDVELHSSWSRSQRSRWSPP